MKKKCTSSLSPQKETQQTPVKKCEGVVCLKCFLSVNTKYGTANLCLSHGAGQSNLVFSYQIVNGFAINTMRICVYVCVHDECGSLSQQTKAPENARQRRRTVELLLPRGVNEASKVWAFATQPRAERAKSLHGSRQSL